MPTIEAEGVSPFQRLFADAEADMSKRQGDSPQEDRVQHPEARRRHVLTALDEIWIPSLEDKPHALVPLPPGLCIREKGQVQESRDDEPSFCQTPHPYEAEVRAAFPSDTSLNCLRNLSTVNEEVTIAAREARQGVNREGSGGYISRMDAVSLHSGKGMEVNVGELKGVKYLPEGHAPAVYGLSVLDQPTAVSRHSSLMRSVLSTPLVRIRDRVGLEMLVSHLSGQSVMAMDLEHARHSFHGATCLMQISTPSADFIVDTLAVWSHMHLLRSVLANPTVTKVVHGADMDVQWLQRDWGLYLVNALDTGRCAQALGLPRGLARLTHALLGVSLGKGQQLSDWSLRPLSASQVLYAPIFATLLVLASATTPTYELRKKETDQADVVGVSNTLWNLVDTSTDEDVVVIPAGIVGHDSDYEVRAVGSLGDYSIRLNVEAGNVMPEEGEALTTGYIPNLVYPDESMGHKITFLLDDDTEVTVGVWTVFDIDVTKSEISFDGENILDGTSPVLSLVSGSIYTLKVALNNHNGDNLLPIPLMTTWGLSSLVESFISMLSGSDESAAEITLPDMDAVLEAIQAKIDESGATYGVNNPSYDFCSLVDGAYVCSEDTSALEDVMDDFDYDFPFTMEIGMETDDDGNSSGGLKLPQIEFEGALAVSFEVQLMGDMEGYFKGSFEYFDYTTLSWKDTEGDANLVALEGLWIEDIADEVPSMTGAMLDLCDDDMCVTVTFDKDISVPSSGDDSSSFGCDDVFASSDGFSIPGWTCSVLDSNKLVATIPEVFLTPTLLDGGVVSLKEDAVVGSYAMVDRSDSASGTIEVNTAAVPTTESVTLQFATGFTTAPGVTVTEWSIPTTMCGAVAAEFGLSNMNGVSPLSVEIVAIKTGDADSDGTVIGSSVSGTSVVASFWEGSFDPRTIDNTYSLKVRVETVMGVGYSAAGTVEWDSSDLAGLSYAKSISRGKTQSAKSFALPNVSSLFVCQSTKVVGFSSDDDLPLGFSLTGEDLFLTVNPTRAAAGDHVVVLTATIVPDVVDPVDDLPSYEVDFTYNVTIVDTESDGVSFLGEIDGNDTDGYLPSDGMVFTLNNLSPADAAVKWEVKNGSETIKTQDSADATDAAGATFDKALLKWTYDELVLTSLTDISVTATLTDATDSTETQVIEYDTDGMVVMAVTLSDFTAELVDASITSDESFDVKMDFSIAAGEEDFFFGDASSALETVWFVDMAFGDVVVTSEALSPFDLLVEGDYVYSMDVPMCGADEVTAEVSLLVLTGGVVVYDTEAAAAASFAFTIPCPTVDTDDLEDVSLETLALVVRADSVSAEDTASVLDAGVDLMADAQAGGTLDRATVSAFSGMIAEGDAESLPDTEAMESFTDIVSTMYDDIDEDVQVSVEEAESVLLAVTQAASEGLVSAEKAQVAVLSVAKAFLQSRACDPDVDMSTESGSFTTKASFVTPSNSEMEIGGVTVTLPASFFEDLELGCVPAVGDSTVPESDSSSIALAKDTSDASDVIAITSQGGMSVASNTISALSTLKDAVTVALPFIDGASTSESETDTTRTSIKCMTQNSSTLLWSASGCTTVVGTDGVECSCDSLGRYGAFMVTSVIQLVPSLPLLGFTGYAVLVAVVVFALVGMCCSYSCIKKAHTRVNKKPAGKV
ncbi:hypothetical protein KIPB_004094 [Kipferlia bialata]|uniref:3'-5' exonuclease domain-containing protein n=1 Tax=Kipferlia bialata TaxID=797122 RepID=A0A9K3GH62_9EUKA|nr:hypothetical protein KIPB_004094 [Kipferlia bialata]|eukprot:g4094.t1